LLRHILLVFQHLREETVASHVVNASVMEEGFSDELDKSLLSTMKKKFLSCARDGIDAVISYVGSSTNRELQTYYEHL